MPFYGHTVEVYHRSPTTTRKAVPVVPLGVNPKARVVVVVERAQADGATRRRLQIHVLTDELQHCHAGLEPSRERGSLAVSGTVSWVSRV